MENLRFERLGPSAISMYDVDSPDKRMIAKKIRVGTEFYYAWGIHLFKLDPPYAKEVKAK